MRRRLTKLAVFLLLGAIVNVGLAWGFALWTPLTVGAVLDEQQRTRLGLKSHFLFRSDAGFGYTEFVPVMDSAVDEWDISSQPSGLVYNPPGGVPYAIDITLWFPALPRRYQWVEEARAGWPVPSLMTQPRQKAPFAPLPVESFDHGFFPPKWVHLFNPKPGRRIPLHPIWRGFAINTIFYAAILWLPFAPFQLRRCVRVKRGHCLKCGYDLRVTSEGACPECGGHRDGIT